MPVKDEAYVGSTGAIILLTGVTGFLGKVVLEELFRRRSELNLEKVIVITRAKRGQDPHSRFLKEIFSSPCFSDLTEGWADSVEVVEGDLALPHCGMDDLLRHKICSEITHIIHCAGCVSFESPLLDAIAANVTASLNICDLAEDCPNLQQLTTTSTAYVQPHRPGGISEQLVDLPYPAPQMLEDITMGRVTEAELLHLSGHQNTYTLTKCIAEHLIMDRKDIVPITVVRPSIISASREYPERGWIDSHAAFAGFVAAFGSGILHVIDGNPKAYGDIVPVDDVARRLIDETMFSTASCKKPRIVYAVAGMRNCVQWDMALSNITKFFNGKPPGPGGEAKLVYFGPRGVVFRFQELIRQKIPFSLAGWWCGITRDEKGRHKMEKVSGLVEMINRVFPYFIHNTFDFRARCELLDEKFDPKEYVSVVCEGVEKHLMRRVKNT